MGEQACLALFPQPPEGLEVNVNDPEEPNRPGRVIGATFDSDEGSVYFIVVVNGRAKMFREDAVIFAAEDPKLDQ